MPDFGVPNDELNTRLELSTPLGWNTFRTRDMIGIVVKNMSQEDIFFTRDFGALIFLYQNNEWVKVSNIVTYPDRSFILPPWNGNNLNFHVADVSPDLREINKAVTIRVFLIGNIYRDGAVTEEKVVSYIDIRLRP